MCALTAAVVVRDAESGLMAGEEGRRILLTDQALQGGVLMLGVLLSLPPPVPHTVLGQLGRKCVIFTQVSIRTVLSRPGVDVGIVITVRADDQWATTT